MGRRLLSFTVIVSLLVGANLVLAAGICVAVDGLLVCLP